MLGAQPYYEPLTTQQIDEEKKENTKKFVTSSFVFPLLKFYFTSTNSETNDEAAVYNVIDKSWTFQDIDCSCTTSKIID